MRFVSVTELRRLLDYDPATGLFVWKERVSHACKAGDRAGSLDTHGHNRIGLFGRSLRASIVAWAITTGEWPDRLVDHKNTVRNDDRWCNLRLATHSQNSANSRRPCHNSSGYKGVDFQKGAWRARVMVAGRRTELGRFSTPLAAYEAYCQAKTTLCGEFGRVE